MNRRGFLGGLLAFAAAPALAIPIPKPVATVTPTSPSLLKGLAADFDGDTVSFRGSKSTVEIYQRVFGETFYPTVVLTPDGFGTLSSSGIDRPVIARVKVKPYYQRSRW